MTPNASRGFTLIEVMIVVVIISILSAIAIPMYKDYVIRSRIMEAVEGLSARQVQMEQCFQDNHTYAPTAPATCAACNTTTGKDFTFSCDPAATATTFTLKATGQGPMDGFVYTVTQANAKATTSMGAGWSGSSATCWITKKDGSC